MGGVDKSTTWKDWLINAKKFLRQLYNVYKIYEDKEK